MTEPTREEIDLVLKAYSKEELARKHCILTNDILRLEANLKAARRTEASPPSTKNSMREYWELKDITIPQEQEEMMNIICDAWEECRTTGLCGHCADRLNSHMRIMACTALKYTRLLLASGYERRSEGVWIDRDGKTWCSLCDASNKQYKPPFCPHCGARMKGGAK